MSRDPLVTALRQVASEIEACGAGNEAAIVRQGANRIEAKQVALREMAMVVRMLCQGRPKDSAAYQAARALLEQHNLVGQPLRDAQRPAAAFPFQTEEAKER